MHKCIVRSFYKHHRPQRILSVKCFTLISPLRGLKNYRPAQTKPALPQVKQQTVFRYESRTGVRPLKISGQFRIHQ
jgi:hypothetical protein